jgi:hypothetical protein
VCCGNSDTCLDCQRVPNGPHRYDVCDICGGNGQSCLDCKGVPNGTNQYDRCDVCGGDGTSCLDCKGNVFGTCFYDACDVCCGNSLECLVVPPERNPCLPRFDSHKVRDLYEYARAHVCDHVVCAQVCQMFPGDVFITQFRVDAAGGRLAGHNAVFTVGYVRCARACDAMGGGCVCARVMRSCVQ